MCIKAQARKPNRRVSLQVAIHECDYPSLVSWSAGTRGHMTASGGRLHSACQMTCHNIIVLLLC